jgi:four helix bundle protein
MNKHLLKTRTKDFALRIIRLANVMPNTTSGRAIANQIVRCGTSVGANYRSALRARSKAEFIAKLGIVLEEADECQYWLEIISESNILSQTKISKLYKEACELVAIFCTMLKSSKS